MYENDITELPASWAKLQAAPEPVEKLPTTNGTNGRTNGYTNGYHNGNTNGYTNGHVNGRVNGHSNGVQELPDSFLEGNAVRTVYGLVPLKFALDWPVFASYDEIAGCAAWMGGRIPTFEEARSIYAYADSLKKEQAERQLGKTVPAVNG
jgi:L-histidine Nalpha-methyltransferase / hercynylcysteine S-oxide synthase